MKCRDCVEFLMEYLDGTLAESERRVFETHIGDCPPCGHYLDSYRETVRLGRTVCEADDRAPEMPEELVSAILAARRAR